MKITDFSVEKNGGWGVGFDVSRYETKTLFVCINLWKVWISFTIRPDEEERT
jgi:hypothetical protein